MNLIFVIRFDLFTFFGDASSTQLFGSRFLHAVTPLAPPLAPPLFFLFQSSPQRPANQRPASLLMPVTSHARRVRLISDRLVVFQQL